MNLTLKWADGEEKKLYDVREYHKHWHTDEYVVSVEYEDGTEGVYTGKELGVCHAVLGTMDNEGDSE